MEKDKVASLLKRIESGYSLPTLSPVAIRLVELASDDKCSANDLVKLIEKDPPLVVSLLKIANSAFFGSVHPITTLNQAVVKIGFHRLRIMALSISLTDTYPMGKIGPLDYGKFWRTSLYRALIAKNLAAFTKETHPEEAFIAGLILEIGLLIFFDLFIRGKEEEGSIELEPFKDLLEWERERCGLDHRQIGGAALRHWNFPEDMVVCQDIYLKEATKQGTPPLVRLCELARSLSGILFLEMKEFSSIYQEADKTLGMNQSIVNDMLMDIFQQVEEIAQNLNVEVDKERDLLFIMEKANKALSNISEKISTSKDAPFEGSLPSFDSISEGEEIVARTLQAVAHEIRNPLLAVGGFAKKLSESTDPSSKGGAYARIILEEAKRLEKALTEMIEQEK